MDSYQYLIYLYIDKCGHAVKNVLDPEFVTQVQVDVLKGLDEEVVRSYLGESAHYPRKGIGQSNSVGPVKDQGPDPDVQDGTILVRSLFGPIIHPSEIRRLTMIPQQELFMKDNYRPILFPALTIPLPADSPALAIPLPAASPPFTAALPACSAPPTAILARFTGLNVLNINDTIKYPTNSITTITISAMIPPFILINPLKKELFPKFPRTHKMIVEEDEEWTVLSMDYDKLSQKDPSSPIKDESGEVHQSIPDVAQGIPTMA